MEAQLLRDTPKPMPESNVEIVRRAYELFNRYHWAKTQGDQAKLEEAWLQVRGWADPELEYREDPSWPGAQTYRGLERCRPVWDEYYEQFGVQTFEPERFAESEDRVVVIVRWVARGSASGASVDMRQGHVHTLRAGRVVKWEIYFDPDAALEAAGLSE